MSKTAKKKKTGRRRDWSWWASLSLGAVGLVGTLFTPFDLLRRVVDLRLEKQLPMQDEQISAAQEGDSSRVETLQPDVDRWNEQAALMSEWSDGLIVLGPSLFMTSILAISNTRTRLMRLWIGGGVLMATAGLYVLLAVNAPALWISSILGFAGVLYCFLADQFAPSNKGDATDRTGNRGKSSRWKAVLQAVGFFILFLVAMRGRRAGKNS